MHNKVASLLTRYHRVIQAGGREAEPLVENYNTLRLADAALDKLKLNRKHPDHPPQVVVLGPTQAGKSTLNNLILDAETAGISALAGYTVHAQGFSINCSEDELAPINALMEPLQRIPAVQLDPHNLNQFVLEDTQTGPRHMLRKGVVWDSPDFDSIESAGYRAAVLQVAAAADALILMVSKDKYADKTVWDMLSLMHMLGKPMMVCINKLDRINEAAVVASFKKRHDKQFGKEAPPIVTLPFIRREKGAQTSLNHPQSDPTVSIDDSARRALHTQFKQLLVRINRSEQKTHTEAFVRHHWPIWMQPVNVELAARQNWQNEVTKTLKEAERLYVTRYLDNPQKYDTFNRALAELLTLLEIPGLASSIAKTRQFVTWPARKLFGLGQQLTSKQTPSADQELEVLNLILEQSLTRLQGHVITQQQESEEQHAWWHAMNMSLTQAKTNIRQEYTATAKELQLEFEPKIEAAAQRLYGQLQEQPMLLNSLRAARVSTDAAAMIMAVKSGGLAAADLVIAPAMLSITTLLTESALGRYMQTIKHQLKEEQLALTQKRLLRTLLGGKLNELTHSLDNNKLLASGDHIELTLD